MSATVRGISVNGRDGSRDVKGLKEYSVIYKVVTDDKRDGPNIVMSAAGIPNLGDIYTAGNDSDSAAVVVNKQAAQVSNSITEWEVTITCSNDLESDPAGFVYQDNPLNKPAEISYGFQTRRIMVPGRFNNPIGPPSDHGWEDGIFSSNGELFEPQPEAEIDEPILSIKKNRQTITGTELMKLVNCVNSDYFQGAEPRQLRLKIPSAVRQWHKSIGYYWEVQYTMAYRWETWDLQLMNQGTYFFTGGKPTNVWSTTQNREVKKDVTGCPIVVNLSTNGDINTTATPTYTRIRFYREVQFGSLGII